MKHSRASGPLVTVVSRTLNQEAYIIVRRNYYRRRFKPVYYWSEGLTYEGRAHWGLAYRFEAEVNKVVTLCLSIIQRFLFFIQRISDSSHFWCKVDDFTCISRRNNGLRLVLPEAIQNARTKDELRAISQISAGETNCHKTVNKITVCEKKQLIFNYFTSVCLSDLYSRPIYDNMTKHDQLLDLCTGQLFLAVVWPEEVLSNL